MKAYETTFQKLVEGTKQFQVPLYQRPYSWGGKELGRLWDDLTAQAEAGPESASERNAAASHFLGSVVLAPSASSAGDMTRWLVIDGQQRLTSLTIALTAVRDRLRELESDSPGEPLESERIQATYLINPYKRGADRYRLLPTQADRAAFKALLDGASGAGTSGVERAHNFFWQLVCDWGTDALLDVEAVIGRRLSLVEIQADPGDNVFRIFESLNNTGRGLSQTDLMRNHVFMLLPETGEEVYAEVWSPMQEELGPETLETLAWLDLVLRGDERAKQSEVYQGQQQRLGEVSLQGGETAVRSELEELRRLGQLLLRVVDPGYENDPDLRVVLARLVSWGNTIYRPLALRLLQLRDRQQASTEEVVRALSYVESYLVRRMLVGEATQGLNRIFLTAPGAVQEGAPVDEEVRRYLSLPRHRWPSDRALAAAISDRNFYWSGRAPQRTFVLRRLEESYAGDEPVDFTKAKLTIEHVMPQSLTPQWSEVLRAQADEDENASELHARLLHTLGNLTLTSQNSRLSNHMFERKQQILDRSSLQMNREIADAESWGRPEIEARAAQITERAIGLWPAPLPGGETEEGPKRFEKPVRDVLAAVPAGSWTTLRDLALLLGTKASTLSELLSGEGGFRNAHRVLEGEGTPLSQAARAALEEEGVDFDDSGEAAPRRRLNAIEIADLLGMEVDVRLEHEQRFLGGLPGLLSPEEAGAVTRLMKAWEDLGGVLDYRVSSTGAISCRLFTWDRESSPEIRWPLVLYPGHGTVEVVFQHLRTRPPFNDVELRREFLKRLNSVPGIDLPEESLDRRPGFPIGALAEHGITELCEVLDWFYRHCRTWLTERG
ncbi:DUF262 domain-containing protein [Nocardiopsis potens]|uniref:DUF262 domain-containing protein n=1 Tax=Nocardiopsis potens TaxID=1246458 RepID=UPI00034ADB84|nr:DUF262 domain-containing protein [Nocardiopsis potens]